MGASLRISTLHFFLIATIASLVLAANHGCGKVDSPPKAEEPVEVMIELTGRFEGLSGYLASDFEVFGVHEDPEAILEDGRFTVEVPAIRPVILFAGPVEDGPVEAELGAENGLLMTPYLGAEYRLTKDSEERYSIAENGDIVMNGVTTIISLVMMHPALAHPGVDEQRELVTLILDLNQQEIIDLQAAGEVWESAIIAQRPFDDDEEIAKHLGLVIDAVMDEKVFDGDEYEDIPGATHLVDLRGQSLSEPVFEMGQGGVSVSKLEFTRQGETLVLKPSTVVGTALEYAYFVHPLAVSNFPQWPHEGSVREVDVGHVYTRSGGQIASGVAPSSSYWSYLDVMGNTMEWISDAIGGATLKRSDDIKLSYPKSGSAFYEVRFYSGGFGYGSSDALYYHLERSYSAEVNAATAQNLAMAMVEVLGIIPGADAMLGDASARQILQAAAVQAVTDLNALIVQKGVANVSGGDIYDILYNTTKKAVDGYIAEASKRTQKRGAIKILRWIGHGGKRALTTILNVPGRISKGGSLANRSYRIARPDSLVEAYIIALGRLDDDVVRFSGSGSASYPVRSGYVGAPITWSGSFTGTMTLPDGTRHKIRDSGYTSSLSQDLGIALVRDGTVTVDYTYTMDLGSRGPFVWTLDKEGSTEVIELTLGNMALNSSHMEGRSGLKHTIEVIPQDTMLIVQGEVSFNSRTGFKADHERIGMGLGSFNIEVPMTTTEMRGDEVVSSSESMRNLGSFSINVWWDPMNALGWD